MKVRLTSRSDRFYRKVQVRTNLNLNLNRVVAVVVVVVVVVVVDSCLTLNEFLLDSNDGSHVV
jgi:signal transduction histidine kinase